VLGLAAMAARLTQARGWWPALVGGGTLVIANLLLVVHYRLELLSLGGALTYADLFTGRFRFVF
jgi:hypothetical protein